MSWTDERVETLKKLWGEGLSCSQIAGRLGGITRNAVIGKVSRLGLAGRAPGARKARGVRSARNAKQSRSPRPPRNGLSPLSIERRKRALMPTFEQPEEAARSHEQLLDAMQIEAIDRKASGRFVSLMERRMASSSEGSCQCAYPLGEPREMLCCGDAVLPGTSYCEAHARRCLQVVSTDALRAIDDAASRIAPGPRQMEPVD